MADATLPPRRSALEPVFQAGDFGPVRASGPGVTISERCCIAIVQLAMNQAESEAVIAAVEQALGIAIPRLPNRTSAHGDLTAIWTGPGRVFLVGKDSRDLEAEISSVLTGQAVALTTLSHSRAVIRLRGPNVRDLLSMGCGLDSHPRRFRMGMAAQSNYGKIGVLIHAVDDEPTVDLYVYRGFAISLWKHLLEGARQFGCRVSA